jgi:CelD/BcsL family acetyltransferase involved in cellulose biosynthesis
MRTTRLKGSGNLSSGIHTRPLTPADASAISQLERETYPEELRAGRSALARDLDDADWEGANLSMGLFDDGRLVGMFLVYYESDSRRMFDYFGINRPPELSPEECLYVADFVVRRRYARYMWRLLKDCRSVFDSTFYGLPMLAFSSRQALGRWQARHKAFARFGYTFVGARRFELDSPPFETFLVRFEASEKVAKRSKGLHVETVRTLDAWKKLAGDWDRLLYQTPDWTPFQLFDVQQIWWESFGAENLPYIVVLRDGPTVRAIAPLQIQPTIYYGRPRRLLKFIGNHSEMDRPTILRNGDDSEAVDAIFAHLMRNADGWDSVLLYEQTDEGIVLASAENYLSERTLIGIVSGPDCPWVDLTGSWDDFLASKSRGFRKSLRRKLARLQTEGKVEFTTVDAWPELEAAFRAYLEVEERSWKPEKGLGVAKDQKSLDYHRALVHALGPRGGIEIRILSVNERPIAATFGLLDSGRFLSLHIAHDRDFDRFSPGVLLTAYELQECYERADHSEYELLGGFLENKTSWTSNVRHTRQLYAYRREPVFMAHYAWHFRVEPFLKRALAPLGLMGAATAFKRFLRERILRSERSGQ